MGSEQISNRGLWDEEYSGFRPWYWPMLPKYIDVFEKKVSFVSKNIDEPISDSLEIKDHSKFLPDSVTEYLGNDPKEISFYDFVMNSGNGVYPQDSLIPHELLSRVASVKISQWLECIVLQRQDILVDAPHLVSRFPSLLNGDHSDLKNWDMTTKFENYREINIDHNKIENYRFVNDIWLSRPAWFWDALSEDEHIPEVANPWEREERAFTFCEDSSKFFNKEECREFNVSFNSPYKRRYVKKDLYTNVEYRPRMKLISSE